MLKLMIADDESLFREALKKTIPWEELGYEICCEAENGYEALEKIAKYKPDVALIDINMPFLNGIELAAEVRENGSDVRVVIITGYDEFNYARQAIDAGVESYLLKPVDEEQLIKVLSSLKKQFEIKVEELKRQVTVYKPLFKEMLLNNLQRGASLYTDKEVMALKGSLSVDYDRPYQAVAVELCEKDEYGWDEDERRLWIFAVRNIATEVFQPYSVFDICQDAYERISIMAQMKETGADWQVSVMNLCERVRISVKKHLKFEVAIGVSNDHTGFSDIPQASDEAMYALRNKLAAGVGKVLFYGNIAEADMTVFNVFPVERRQQLLMAARMNEISEVEGGLHSIFDEIRRSKASDDMILVKCMELVSTCFEFIAGTGNGIKCVFGDNFNYIEELHKKHTVDDLEAWMTDIYLKAMNSVQTNKSKRSSKTVEDARKYINDNFHRTDLKIDDIARHVFVRYGHLCFLFKRETGKTINDFITEIRIKKARELMDAGYRSVSAVSGKVGYADANYFGKCFRKINGIAPGKYIENIENR